MKFNYISASTIPSKTANSVHVMKMAQALSKIGFNLTLYCRGKYSDELEKDFKTYGVKKIFQLIKIQVPGIKYINGLYYTIKVLRDIKNKNESSLESVVYYGRDLLTMTILSFFYKNIYYEAHELPSNIIKKILLKILFKSNNFNGLVVISDALKTLYRDEYRNLTKIIVLHDGADIIENKYLIPNKSEIVIGYTGSIYQGRGIEKIIEMACRLPNFKFQIVGGDKKQVRKLFTNEHEIKLPSNLEFVGYVNPKEIPKYLQSMSIVLAPYQKKVGIANPKKDTSKWMSPLKIFEYMSAQKSIICSDIPVLREVLKDKHNCLLVDPESIDDWVEAIKKLIENEELRNKIAMQARKDLIKNYSWDVRANKLKEIITYNKK